MDSHTLLEEEVMNEMHSSIIERFDLDHRIAAELTLEIMDMLSLFGANFSEKNQNINSQKQTGLYV